MAEILHVDLGRAAYGPTLELQEKLVAEVQADGSRAHLLTVEHDPPVITLGRRAKAEHIVADPDRLAAAGIELVKIRRGGDVTWHGPGQLVAYPILRLDKRRWTLHAYVHRLEQAVIDTLAKLGIEAGRREGLIGVWVGQQKVAAIGVAVARWVTYHGLSLNVAPDTAGFDAIVPCGIHDASITSISRLLGRDVTVDDVKPLLVECLTRNLDFEGITKGGESTAVKRTPRPRLPRWLRKEIPAGPGAAQVRKLLSQLDLHTVCSSAHCPNQAECFARKTATFMILGDHCTRNCRFCAVSHDKPLPVDAAEPAAVAEAAATLGLRHVVITSVTRDDLPDGGADHFAAVTKAVREKLPESVIEILIPDFQGDEQALAAALAGGCDVLNHNVETVPRLYASVRPQADYHQSLSVLAAARRIGGTGRTLYTKSGLMVGLGETREELLGVFADLREAGCDILTVGQYLAPSPKHHPVVRFVEPAEFDELREAALKMGFAAVAAGPFVRSSYQAESVFVSAETTEIGAKKKKPC